MYCVLLSCRVSCVVAYVLTVRSFTWYKLPPTCLCLDVPSETCEVSADLEATWPETRGKQPQLVRSKVTLAILGDKAGALSLFWSL